MTLTVDRPESVTFLCCDRWVPTDLMDNPDQIETLSSVFSNRDNPQATHLYQGTCRACGRAVPELKRHRIRLVIYK